MMGTLVQVQLYTFIYRKALFRPQIVPKIANWGLRADKIAKSKKYASTKKKVFLECKRQNVFRALEKLKKIKKSHILTIFPFLGKLTHICIQEWWT